MARARVLASLLVFVVACGPELSSADPCAEAIEGDVVLEVPADAAQLAKLEGVRCIRGDLELHGEQEPVEAETLAVLSTLEVVEGDLRIEWTGLRSLELFPRLTRIAGEFVILGNVELVELEGPPQLAEIGGGLTIAANDSLLSIAGFDALRSVGSVAVFDNWALLTVIGPSELERIDGDLQIAAAPDLESLEGLRGLREVTGSVSLGQCHSDYGVFGPLASFAGLRNLEVIGGDLELVCVDSPNSMIGFAALTSIGGDLRIHGNSFYGTWGIEEIATPSLVEIGGGLSVWRMETFRAFVGLERVEQLAYLRLEMLPELQGFAGLASGLRVGDVSIKNNGIAQTTVDEFLAGVEITGEVEVCGNSEDFTLWCD